MQIEFKDMMRVAQSFLSDCHNAEIKVKIIGGDSAILVCAGVPISSSHEMDGDFFYRKPQPDDDHGKPDRLGRGVVLRTNEGKK